MALLVRWIRGWIAVIMLIKGLTDFKKKNYQKLRDQ